MYYSGDMATVNTASGHSKRRKDRPDGRRKATYWFTELDREHAAAIVKSGWASNTTGAIRFALKFTAEKVGA